MKAHESGDAEGAALADSLYRKACTLGAPNACTNHAAHLWAFARGDADLACAQRLFERTCEHEDPFGCGMAGRLLIDRADGPDDEDITHARALLERSCAQLGHFPCRILALNLERGRLGPVPDGRIPALLQQACEAGDEPACGEHETVEETFGP
jgi:TPR repeat protein